MNSNVASDCFDMRNRSSSPGLLTAVAVIMALTAVYTLLSNGTVFLAMLQTILRDGRVDIHNYISHNNNSYITKLLMLSMTVYGVLTGVLVMPLALMDFISNSDGTFGQSIYKLRFYSDYLLTSISTFHITFMAIDTYLVICKPLLYRLLKAKTGYVMIATGWMLPGIIIVTWKIDDQ
ncbi:Trace amine-associated receptor 1 [Bulinus truncatus]|nr:Trace amine-associated receptor 1 [Bulinus truncatus]